ncbi:WD40 repeat domain-containing protein [Chloroherpeton thalassium]|uniref:WD40 repeat domain-containing protein n=1 Tax=Chloroherpeton thalassium TaxID=100716 RepID=UPI0002FBAB05|nr:hypothetical protein [Chloroherpeton thalassium]
MGLAQKKLRKLQKEYRQIDGDISKQLHKSLTKLAKQRPKKWEIKDTTRYNKLLANYNAKKERVSTAYENKADRLKRSKHRQIMQVLNQSYTDKVKLFLGKYDSTQETFDLKVRGAGYNFPANVAVPKGQVEAFKKNFRKAKAFGTFRIVENQKPYLVRVKAYINGRRYNPFVPLAYYNFQRETLPGGKPVISFSPNGRYMSLASGGAAAGSQLTVWDTYYWQDVVKMETKPDDDISNFWPSKAIFDPNGKYLIAGGMKPDPRALPTTKVFSIRKWKELKTLNGCDANFSTDGKYLISVINDKDKKVWRMGTWEDQRKNFLTDQEYKEWVGTLEESSKVNEQYKSTALFRIERYDRDTILVVETQTGKVAAKIPAITPYENPPKELTNMAAIRSLREKEFYDEEIFTGISPDGNTLIRVFTHTYPIPGEEKGREYSSHVHFWRLLWNKYNYN